MTVVDIKPAESGTDPKTETAKTQTIAATLAQFAAELSYDDIPEHVRVRAKHLMLDATGIALASTRWDFAYKTLTGLQGLAGPGDISVIGSIIDSSVEIIRPQMPYSPVMLLYWCSHVTK